MTTISAIGTHLPRMRLSRAAISAAMKWLTPGIGAEKGARTVGFWDEDSITMGVEAARACLAQAGDSSTAAIETLRFATTTPTFLEFQNASIMHGALRLAPGCSTEDLGGTKRAGLVALHQALEHGGPALIVAADRPLNPAGSLAESRQGDGAAAVLVGHGAGLLSYLGGAGVTTPFADRYRPTGQDFAVEWEERWIREEGFLKQVPRAVAEALQKANLQPENIDHFVMPCVIPGCGKAVAQKAGLANARLAPNLVAECGDTGSGHALLMLAHAMEGMKPGDRVVVAQFGQGATALVFEATDAIADFQPVVSPQLARGIEEENYLKLPIFQGMLAWEKGLRGRINVNEALSVAFRRSRDLLGFVGGRCRQTGTVQFPASRLAAGQQGLRLDTLDPYPLADLGGTIATCTADSLAFSRHPPNCYGLIDFHGGGRLMMDFTDPDAEQLRAGDEVRFVFRIKDHDDQTGYQRYFWKAVAADRTTAQPAE